jgi:hypothetical protein
LCRAKASTSTDRRAQPGVGQQGQPVLDELPLGRHQEDRHLGTRPLGIQDLEVQLHALHVEGHVLVRLPPDQLARIGLTHPIHLDLLDDDVVTAHRGHHVLPGDAGGVNDGADGLGHQDRVHDLALHDGVCHQRAGGDPRDLRIAPGVVHDHQLDEAAPDVEARCDLASAEESHASGSSESIFGGGHCGGML